jgi:hypothetical protein
MGNDKIFFSIRPFSNISQNPFTYQDDPEFTFIQKGSMITVENEEIRLEFNAALDTKFFDKETGQELDFKEFDILDMMVEGNLEPILKKMNGAHKEETYYNWNLELLTVKKKTSLSGLGEYIGWSFEEILSKFPEADIIKKDYLHYSNVPEYCFISFKLKHEKVFEITFYDDFY